MCRWRCSWADFLHLLTFEDGDARQSADAFAGENLEDAQDVPGAPGSDGDIDFTGAELEAILTVAMIRFREGSLGLTQMAWSSVWKCAAALLRSGWMLTGATAADKVKAIRAKSFRR